MSEKPVKVLARNVHKSFGRNEVLRGVDMEVRTGEVHGEEGDLIQTCVNAAAGPVQLDI